MSLGRIEHRALARGIVAAVTASGLVVVLGRVIGGSGDLVALGGAAVVIALATWPLAWDLYERDKASRKVCPDCCEEVKVGARVCRYCGYRWTEAWASGGRRLTFDYVRFGRGIDIRSSRCFPAPSHRVPASDGASHGRDVLLSGAARPLQRRSVCVFSDPALGLPTVR